MKDSFMRSNDKKEMRKRETFLKSGYCFDEYEELGLLRGLSHRGHVANEGLEGYMTQR